LGFAEIVVFYVIDYVPVRFNNRVLNSLYRVVDKICVCHVDFTWNLTFAMTEAREKIGIKQEWTNQMVVPTGTHFEKIEHLPFEQVERAQIAFLSHLRKGQGIELILEALPIVIKKVPSAQLLVIGTGPLESYFKTEVQKKGLEKNVKFLGYIKNHDEIERIISKCSVGIAPYVPDPDSYTWFADPGKPKVYMGCGVPVIITRVPEVALEIEKRGAGIAIKYDKQDLSDALVRLLTDDNLYRKCRSNALDFASTYTWDNVFCQAFNQVLAHQN
jgi:glycosyltransferase involved in cell wall biosynthesis